MKLKLSGNGTLTVTSQSREYCGLVGNTNYTDSNNACDTITSIDVSDKLAAPGHTVIRSARTDGPDEDGDTYTDYYTWTYTVYPNPSTVSCRGLLHGEEMGGVTKYTFVLFWPSLWKVAILIITTVLSQGVHQLKNH